MNKRRSLLLLAAAPALWAGCMPDVPGPDPEPTPRVSAVFDAATSTVPLPNTAALQDDGTLPRLPGAGEDSANGAFLEWLDGVHGWLAATPIVIPFSGELDPATVTTDSVKLFHHTSSEVVEIPVAGALYLPNDGTRCDPSVCGSQVVIQPAVTLQPGATYSAIALKSIKGANGLPVGESTAVFFAASSSPIVDDDGNVTIGVLKSDPQTAATLEGLRRMLAPTFAAAEAAGVDRSEIASAQSWTIAQDPFTVLDPATSTLPIPNTLAIEADGTFPSAALTYCGGPNVDLEDLQNRACGDPAPVFMTCEATSDCDQYQAETGRASQCIGGRCLYTNCAQGGFDAYLDQLHGWPTTTPITLPVTAPIDEATLTADSIQVWVLSGGVPAKIEGTTATMSACGDQIAISLPADAPAMAHNTQYLAFATRDVKGTNGLALKPPPAVLLAMMPHEPGEFVGDCTAEQAGQACDGGGVCGGIPEVGFKCVQSLVDNASDADAAAVMAIRPLFQPLIAAVAAGTGLEWTDLASIWTWSTWSDTFIVFDPTTGSIPFPHTLLTMGCSEDEPICNLPDGQGATAPIIEELKRRDGFSSTAPHWLPVVGPPLDPTTIKNWPVNEAGLLFAEADVTPPRILDDTMWNVTYEFDHLVARFNRPLKPQITVAGLTTTHLRGENGFPAQPTPAFVFLRSSYPLVDAEGRRTISQIPDDATAAVLEASRRQFEELFLVAAISGYGRLQINSAWAFGTGQTYLPLQQLRAQTLHELGGAPAPATKNSPDDDAAPFVNGNNTVPDPDMVTVDVDVSNLSEIQWNIEFETVNWLNEDNTLADSPTTAPVGVSVFIPGGTCTAPYNVAIAQHGLGNYRKNLGLAVANELAGSCIATVAMDLPLHGGRVSGSPELHPASRPAESGSGFVSADFVGTVNNFKQAVVDLSVLTRLIKSGGLDAATGVTFSNADSQIGYIGNSLGAFAGTLLTTIEPDIGPTILNVVGGNFGTILKDSAAFNPILAGTGIPADTFAEIQALHFVQWLGEHADPYAFAPYPVLNPLTEVTFDGTDFDVAEAPLPSKDVMIQMVVDDPTIPNSSTEPVARVMGVDLTDTTFPAGTPHGFLGVLDASSDAFPAQQCAVQQAAEWMASSFTADAELTSTADCASSL